VLQDNFFFSAFCIFWDIWWIFQSSHFENSSNSIPKIYIFFDLDILSSYMPKLSLFIIAKIVKAPSRKFNFLLWKEIQPGIILPVLLHNITASRQKSEKTNIWWIS
jgi:hypothetical protein